MVNRTDYLKRDLEKSDNTKMTGWFLLNPWERVDDTSGLVAITIQCADDIGPTMSRYN